jgi:2-polyprenyl-6-methoxyphenol hydroxylase-like FAD-dependent oxidoreductase
LALLTISDRGQGLNHSIQDVVNLIEALQSVQRGTPLADAISAYDAELVKRGSDEVRTSVHSAILSHDAKKLMEAPVMKQGYVKTELK